jgi:hypothetical protein
MRCVVERFNGFHTTLEELALSEARPDIHRNTDWFVSCASLSREFEWERFEGDGSEDTAIQLRTPNVIERSEAPGGTWYIKEGVHRMLVAAVLLDSGAISWRPFRALRR